MFVVVFTAIACHWHIEIDRCERFYCIFSFYRYSYSSVYVYYIYCAYSIGRNWTAWARLRLWAFLCAHSFWNPHFRNRRQFNFSIWSTTKRNLPQFFSTSLLAQTTYTLIYVFAYLLKLPQPLKVTSTFWLIYLCSVLALCVLPPILHHTENSFSIATYTKASLRGAWNNVLTSKSSLRLVEFECSFSAVHLRSAGHFFFCYCCYCCWCCCCCLYQSIFQVI